MGGLPRGTPESLTGPQREGGATAVYYTLLVRTKVTLLVTLLPALGCYEPSIEGLIDPNDDCEYPTDSSVRTRGTLDIGPVVTLANSYDAVMLVEGKPGHAVTSASVAFSSNGERLPNVTIAGEEFVFPSVEGERHSTVEGTVGEDGKAAVPFTLVTQEEAIALQTLIADGEELDMLVELRAVVGRTDTTYPSFVELRICERCLVGVGAEVQGADLVCPDGSAPTIVVDAPCRKGQDDVFSTCDER
jgi:hypothetical protein